MTDSSYSYIGAQLPSNLLITRIRPSLYLPSAAIIWSIVSASTAAVTNRSGLFALRVCLGFVEAPLYPGAVFVLSCWYTRKELALRFAILYTGLVLAMAISGLIAAGVFAGMEGAMGLAGWQWLFIIEGAIGCVFAIAALFLLPDYPGANTGSARWSMSEDLRRLAAARMQVDRVSESEEKHTILNGLRLSLTDYKTYVFVSKARYVDEKQPWSVFVLLTSCHRCCSTWVSPHRTASTTSSPPLFR
jgi:MFS family permease